MPIATAGLGPLAAGALLVFFGFFNVLTMACMAEAFGRNGSIRYGGAFTGRVVSDYVGGAGSLLLTSATAMRLSIGLLACYYGLSAAMASLTSMPPSAWAAFLFLLALYLLAGKSLNFSTALSALLGAVSISLVLVISLAALNHLQWANLSYVNVPFLGGRPFERAILQVAFGVVIQSYLGHTYLTQCAKIVLPRDPGAGSLIRGTVAASVATTVLLCGWVLVINGVLAPSTLAGQSGTVLTPLARQIGPHVNFLGFFLIILLLGLAFIRQSTVLFNLVRERLPARTRPIVMLPRRRGSIFLHKRGTPDGSPRLGLTYLGLTDDQPQFRLDVQWDGNVHRMEMSVPKSWDATALFERLPQLRPHGISLALETLEAAPEGARVRITSTMSLSYEGEWDAAGLHIADISTLRDALRQLVNWMTRRGEVSLAEVMAYTGGDERMARMMVQELIELGFVRPLEGEGNPRYRIHLAARRGRRVSEEIWQALGEKGKAQASPSHVSRWRSPSTVALWAQGLMLSEGGRFFLSMSPVMLVFLLTEWLVLTGASSFTGLLAVGGLLANSLVGGIFPVLLLVSSRRKGDLVPDLVIRLLDHPFVVAGIYLLFLCTLLLHAIVIWLNPAERAAALLVSLLVLAATVAMVRQGALTRRVIVELKEDARAGGDRRAVFAITANGQPAVAEVELSYADGEQRRHEAVGEVPAFGKLRSATFHLPATQARELKVWAHTVTPDGASESLPALVEVHCGDGTRQFDLKLSGGQVVMPLTSGECSLRITLPKSDSL